MSRAVAVTVKAFGLNAFCMIGSDGDYFYNAQDKIRTYSKPGGAVAFLRRTGYKWIVNMPSGRKLFVNCVDPELAAKLGPHDWEKKNAVTIIDKSGNYDVWRCKLCRKEKKNFGLSGRPLPGACKKNPLASRATQG